VAERPHIDQDAVCSIVREVEAAADFQQAVERLTDWARQITGCEAAMARFREDDSPPEEWIPALVERGFDCSFLRDELLIGAEECLCGRVCRGCPDHGFPFFTPGGSFAWGSVQTIGKENPFASLGHVRARCMAEGFDSLLIVPIMAGASPIGCVHLADHAGDKFTDHVETLEAACRLCGPSLLRFSDDDRQAAVIRAVETALAPPALQQIAGLDVAVSYTSATETAHLGGDFFEVIELGEGDVLFVVGDYSGKGISAAGMAARARQAIAFEARADRSVAEILGAAEARLRGGLPPGKFVTVAACRYSPGGELECVVAGHPYPLVLEPDGEATELAARGNPPLGFSRGGRFFSSSARLRTDQTLLLFTDGIVESRRDGRFFGLEGIGATWQTCTGEELSVLTARLCADSAAFHDPRHAGDDRLALAARVKVA
jgi:serine phosphatase RsbU (regulator of sigma subunit)